MHRTEKTRRVSLSPNPSSSFRLLSDHKKKKKKKGSTTPLLTRIPFKLLPSYLKLKLVFKRDRHDVDIGGAPYMVMVENLEKGISPFTMMEFIHDQVSIPCQVTISPCKSWESYTRGIITVDSKKKLDKISDFLETPDHSVISSKGRPWVITEKKPVHDMSLASIQAFLANYQQNMLLRRRPETSNELKVVLSGTEEYKSAKLLEDLFWEFINHQSRLHQRLLIEEAKISQQFDEDVNA